MGLAGIAVPEELGGAGGTLLDLAVALEAAAGALVPGPLLGTAVASVALGELAGPVASGEMRVALALGADGLVHDAPGATHALRRSRRRGAAGLRSRTPTWPRAPRRT